MTHLKSNFINSTLFAPRLWPRPALIGFKALSVVFALIIIYASLTPSVPGPEIQHFDKLMHALAYASLAAALRLGWPVIWGGFILTGAGAFGVGIEFAQAGLANGRTGSLADAIVNVIGACLALAILYPFRRKA